MTATQRWTLAVVCAATAMLMLDIAVVNTALTAISADLDTGLSGLQWIVDAYTLTLAATVVTAGSLADRFGRRRLFVAGLAVFTAMSLLCGLAQSITMLNVARGAQGIGAAIMFAVSLAVLSNAFPNPQERVKALAAYGATMPGAFAIGPLVGGALTSGLDWRWIFLINLPLGALCLWIVRTHVAESLDPRAPRVDVGGLLTLTGALFLLVFALLRDGSGLLYGAAALLALSFVAIEARSAQPLLPLRLFRNPSFTGAQVGAVGISGSLFALWLYLTLYLQQVLGLSAIEAGLVFVPGTLLNFVVAGATASVAQMVPARMLVAGGLALIGAGLAVLTSIGVDSSWWLFLPGLLVAMVGTGMLNPALAQVALSALPPEQSGLAAGVNDMFRQAALAVGVAGLGALISTSTPRAYVDGLHDALWVGAALALACAVATALLIQSPARPSRSVKLAPDPAS
jgi:EmrB/QacA subfamily drug resistance transporter